MSPVYEPIVPEHIGYEVDGQEGYDMYWNLWCDRCDKALGSTTAAVAMDLVDEHGDCRDTSGQEQPYDSGPSDSAYRYAMQGSGKGNLLR